MRAGKQKVIVGLSGGVDSSVTASLLLDQGYEVVGAFMKNWSENDPENCSEDCGWQRERQDALKVAAQLGIPFMTFDFEKEYRERVVNYMIAEYSRCRTPNPDVLCNSLVKFDLFLEAAKREGADFIATGHYARVRQNAAGKYELLAGVDTNKDQSYFLHQLTQDQLVHTLFPIGHLTKPEVRAIAREKKLLTAEKKDSQGICFVGKVDLADFLRTRIPQTSGPIITVDGKKIGEHQGLAPYTVGQRHGMNIGGGEPYFVVSKNCETNTLTVAPISQQDVLMQTELTLESMHWIAGEAQQLPLKCKARIRYRQPLQDVTITASGDTTKPYICTFVQPIRAVTPGQFAVFYNNDTCLGGGVIM